MRRFLTGTISAGALAISLMTAAPAFADPTPDCNTGDVDPTSL